MKAGVRQAKYNTGLHTAPAAPMELSAGEAPGVSSQPMSFQPARFTDVQRSGPPTTRNGTDWTIPISKQPPDEWLQFLRNETGGDDAVGVQWAVNVQGVQLQFTSTPDDVPKSLASIDRWIIGANDRYRSWLSEAHRKGDERRRGEQTEADRVRDLNERFKDL
jgi:hypothetical protein